MSHKKEDTTMSDKSLDKYFVHSPDGSLNKTATLQKFEVALEERNAYLTEVFAALPKDAKGNVKFIIGSTMRAIEAKLGHTIPMADYTETEGHCNDYLQMLKATGQVSIVKGPRGGVSKNATFGTANAPVVATESSVPVERVSLPAIEISTASGKPEVIESTDSE